MKKFLISTILFILLLLSVAFIGDYIVTNGLRKAEFGDFKEWNGVFNGTINADFIINGSSRANIHVSPYVVDSILNTNSYNLGMTGYHFDMQNCRFNLYIKKNKKPRFVIQSLSSFEFEKKTELLDYEQFLPYLDNTDIKNATKKYEGLAEVDYIIPFFRYRSKFEIIKSGILEFFGIYHKPAVNYKGYNGINSKWGNDNKFKSEYFNKNVVIDKRIMQKFEKFIIFCNENDIKLYLVYSPEYIESQSYVKNREEIMQIYQEISEKYDVPFLDYSNDSMSYNKSLFFDSQHLNKKGAEMFSVKLANDIKELNKVAQKEVAEYLY